MTSKERENLFDRLRKASTAVYVVMDEGPASDVSDMLKAAADTLQQQSQMIGGLPVLADGQPYRPETPVFRADGQPGRLCFDPDIGWNAWPDLDATDSSGWPVPAEKCHPTAKGGDRG